MDRPRARRLLLLALILGVAADVLLDGPALGINVPILVVAVPVLVDALPRLRPADAAMVRRILQERRSSLIRDPGVASPAAWNLARQEAVRRLAELP